MKRRDELLLWNRFVNTREVNKDRRTYRQTTEYPERAYCPGPSIRMVARELGIAEKRAGYLADKWAREGLVEYGVSVMAPWLTPKGARAEIGLYGFSIADEDRDDDDGEDERE